LGFTKQYAIILASNRPYVHLAIFLGEYPYSSLWTVKRDSPIKIAKCIRPIAEFFIPPHNFMIVLIAVIRHGVGGGMMTGILEENTKYIKLGSKIEPHVAR